MVVPRCTFPTLLLALLLGAVGCKGGSDLERTDVSGTVTLDGEPVAYGLLFLRGQPTEKQNVTQVYLLIRDGKFSSSEQKVPGPSPGDNDVTVTVYAGPPPSDEQDEESSKAKVKGLYSSKVSITKGTPLEVKVTKGDATKEE